MFSIGESIIAGFCCVDELLQEVSQGQPIRHGGFAPALSDAEVLTMEIVGECQCIATDEGIWQYFTSTLVGMVSRLVEPHQLNATSGESGAIQSADPTATQGLNWLRYLNFVERGE